MTTARERSSLHRLAAFALLLALFAPAVLLFRSPEDVCCCGMGKGCLCQLMAGRRGQPCGGMTRCAMKKTPASPAGQALPVFYDPRGCLEARLPAGIVPPEPCGPVPVSEITPPPPPGCAPETPPPQPLQLS